MIVAALTVDLIIPDARSLKDKRRVIKGLKEKLRNRFNVSVVEVGSQDQHQRCQLGVAMVSLETRSTHSQLDKIVELVRHTAGTSLIDYKREFL